MTAIELLYEALPAREPPEIPGEAICCVLGTREPTIDRRHAIKPSFTNLDVLRAPDSERVSVRAWRVLTHSKPAKEGKKRDTFPLMQSAWMSSNRELILLNRHEIREIVVNGGDPFSGSHSAWAGYVTTSYKKHGCLRAPVNTNGSQRWLFETEIVDCSDRAQVQDWWTRLREAREAGIPRSVIETLDISVPLFAKHRAHWQAFEPWARLRYQSVLYRFLTYLLPSQEELRADDQ